jgi:type IV secretory pathway VirB10-like protein
MTNRRFSAVIMGVFATALAACSPGYMKASELESKHQGPADCEARCVELGMRMGALVLVSDTLPGCVCQPTPAAAPPAAVPPAAAPPTAVPPAAAPPPTAPAPPVPPPAVPGVPPTNPGPAAPISDASQQGASAATASYVVATMAAAAAARANQTELQRRTQQSYVPK